VATGAISAVSEERFDLGEGPLWHPLWGELLIVDIDSGNLHRFDAGLASLGTRALGRVTSALAWRGDGALLCFHEGGNVGLLPEPNATLRTVITVPGLAGSRFNDVIVDPRGRLLCGVLATDDAPGRLYRIDPDGTIELLLDGLGEPNGLAFSNDGRSLYFADSVTQTIWLFDYGLATGRLGGQVLFHQARGEELPDGLTVDAEDRLYTALWGGSGLLQFGRSGRLEARITLDVKWPTSLAFGGPAHDNMYVTSARPSGIAGKGISPIDGAVLRLGNMGVGRSENPAGLLAERP
jgi:D-xylono/L-arabinono-1,4-lactonase